MKIVLEQENKHVIMKVVADYIVNDIDHDWGASITDIADELKDRQGVRRMSYDTWHWDLRKLQEAEEYLTYFYLKHDYKR